MSLFFFYLIPLEWLPCLLLHSPQTSIPPGGVVTPEMLKIWSMKQKQQEAENAEGAAGKKKKKVTAAQLRVQRDLQELTLGSTMKMSFPNPDDILNFTLTIEPDEGMYKGGVFNFSFAVNQNFPHDPPKVKCTQKIYHPNIDLEGNVCLNILREDWKPVLNLNAVIVGMQFLFLEPNASDPLNKDAAEDLRATRDTFKKNVRNSMAGGSVRGISFERVLR
ncbi:NEDD8-conjugating enzyme [Penicillium chrysogenum]|nr:NEDD8-conjugating enzyme [Penicillium chrysogenum]